MEHRYIVRFDDRANRRFNRALLKSDWWAWLRSLASYTLRIGLLLSIIVYASRTVLEVSLFRFLAYGFGWAAAISLVYHFVHYHRSLDAMSESSNESWECVMTDESWTSIASNGVAISIPWTLMKIDFATDDAWVVKYGEAEIVIDRISLRKAGLEDEFRARASQE